MLSALLAAVEGELEPSDRVFGEEFSAAAIMAATASTSIPWSGLAADACAEANVLTGTGGPFGKAFAAFAAFAAATSGFVLMTGNWWVVECLLDRGGATG